MPFKVFISYSTKDLELVNNIQQSLNIPDVSVFVARYSIPIGDRNLPEIEKAIDDCDLFVVLWTQNSHESDWVKQEIGYAVAKNKWFLPIVMNRELELPPFIRELNYFPAYDYPNELYAWLRRSISSTAQEKQQKELLGAIGVGATILLLITAFSNSDGK